MLCKIGISTSGAIDLSEALTKMPNLHHLDISNNFINNQCFTYMFTHIAGKNSLKSLDVSYNNTKPITGESYTANPKGKKKKK